MESTAAPVVSSDAVMEGTMSDLLQAQPVETREDRKRAGRPAVGGRGEIWDALQRAFLADGHVKTKNGLPGVPYSVRNTLTAIKTVWSEYAPGVVPGAAPADWMWLATAADSVIQSITHDVYATDGAKFLHALADTCAVLARRATSEHVTDAQAPIVLYTEELQAKYRTAAVHGRPLSLHPTPSALHHHVAYEDWVRMRDWVRRQWHQGIALAAAMGKEQSPELARLLGWANLALSFQLPVFDNGAPLDVRYADALTHGSLLDTLVVAKAGAPLPKGEHNTVHYDRDAKTAVITLAAGTPKEAVLVLPAPVSEAVEWAFTQRDSAVHMERLLPRRLSVDVILRRLSRNGPLKACLKGKVLTAAGCRMAWTTHAFADALGELSAAIERVGLGAVDPLTVLAAAVYPRTLEGVQPLLLLGDDIPAAALLKADPVAEEE